MANTLSSIATIFRSMISLILLALLGTGSWMAYQTYHERERLGRELQEAKAEVDRIKRENERLELALRLLKVDHRVAQIEVLDQKTEGDRLTTTFQFVELGPNGQPIGDKKVFTLEGDRVYVEAWVIKYNDELVESGDPLGSTSVCLFRRVFGEHLSPDKGFTLDSNGSRPAIYSQDSDMSPVERDIWANFWDYANNPSRARQAGVRAVHGEAPNMRLQPGSRYRVDLRASGGLSIVPEETHSPDATLRYPKS
jgi:hypothetical protein